MLLRFGVANHCSNRGCRDQFPRAPERIKRKALAIPVPTFGEDAAPIVAIFGADTAGKSKLVDMLDEVQSAIVRSHNSLGAARIPRKRFRLDSRRQSRHWTRRTS